MQTFLPYPSFEESAKVLDRLRLGKQRVEVLTLLRVLSGEREGWQGHPCTRMWRGYEGALASYGVAVCREWISKGYADGTLPKISAYLSGANPCLPHWLGGEIHLTHRLSLLNKDFGHYRRFFPERQPFSGYYWP